MRRMKNLRGVLVPIVIPMFEEGTLDHGGSRRLAETFLSLPSCNGLFALGATSEFMHLSFEERKALIEGFGTIDRGEKVIMVNTGGLPLDQVIELTRLVVSVGLDGVAVVVPADVPTETAAVEQAEPDASAGEHLKPEPPPPDAPSLETKPAPSTREKVTEREELPVPVNADSEPPKKDDNGGDEPFGAGIL